MTSSSPSEDVERATGELRQLFIDGLAAADPEALTAAACRQLRGQDWTVVAMGKAACAMARGAAAALGDRVIDGLVVTNTVNAAPWPVRIASHPAPDDRSEAAARELLRVVSAATGPVLALISGGASSLVCLPAPGLELADKRAATAAVMQAGASIDELNTVRKHLSSVKGGRLAAATRLPMTTMALSDVVGDSLSVIASGPTVADPTTFGDAVDVCRRYGVWSALPPAIRAHLEAGCEGTVEESPKQVEGQAQVIAGLDTVAARVAALMLRRHGGVELGVRPTVGDVGAVAAQLARRAAVLEPGTAWVGYGETTVELGPNVGIGGRSLQLALLVARSIARSPAQILVAGTDGIDGVSPAAGAVVDGSTWQRLAASGAEPERALQEFDAYPALASVGATIECGPTGLNHADLFIVRVP